MVFSRIKAPYHPHLKIHHLSIIPLNDLLFIEQITIDVTANIDCVFFPESEHKQGSSLPRNEISVRTLERVDDKQRVALCRENDSWRARREIVVLGSGSKLDEKGDLGWSVSEIIRWKEGSRWVSDFVGSRWVESINAALYRNRIAGYAGVSASASSPLWSVASRWFI